MTAENLPAQQPPEGQFLLYQTEDGQTRIECRFSGETIWLSQAGMVDLYQTTKQNISLHRKNLYEEGELVENRVVKEYLTTGPDGKNYRRQSEATVKEYLTVQINGGKVAKG